MNRMRNYLLTTFVVLMILFAAVGCSKAPDITISYQANYEGRGELLSQAAVSGKKLEAPDTPTREGYTFLGWYKDATLDEAWDFSSTKATESLSLYAGWDKDTGDSFASSVQDKDFSKTRTPGSQESSYEYKLNFLPSIDGVSQPYVGDPMPYYEDGTYYLYYLKDGGDSYNHSIYLATTTDFLSFTEYDTPVLEASRSGGQDGWIGTGSVVKVDGKYYFFYTGHAGSETMEYKEKVMVAIGDTPYSFQKKEGWAITPPSELGQKNDFRDPQAYIDSDTGRITLTITAAQSGVARIIKYSLNKDLGDARYEGIILSDPIKAFWNLECSDTFRIGNKWYITYSGQDDTLWYAMGDSQFGPYTEPQRIDDKLFYAAKHVSDGNNTYMVGWTRRSESPSSTQDVSAWGGNLSIQQVKAREDGSLYLLPVENVEKAFSSRRQLLIDSSYVHLSSGSVYSYKEVFTAYERFMLKGEFRFTGDGTFGLAFDYNNRADKYKMVSIDPKNGTIQLLFNEGSTMITETAVQLEKNKDYSFTYIQEGSVGVFYIDGIAALTTRLYGVSGKAIRVFTENNDVLFTSLREYTF